MMVYKLFLKWLLRPILEQQNGFNQAAARLIEDLVESQERTAREVRQLGARVEALERRVEGEPPG
jgi:polyhydroxyalkanoate synthesis regulator phasin